MFTVLGQINKMCPLTGVISFGEGEDARVYDLPLTQPEVATERHMKKTTIYSSRRKRVITHE